tara:strand:- start:12 stop:230 length:219 start_codon:yes stop_codon:yes gene_type:complete
MSIKPIIILLIVGILVSLASSLFFLFKDKGQGKRTVYGLGIRVTLAILLIILVAYGLSTGELGNSYVLPENL